jgi:hypothetical protein
LIERFADADAEGGPDKAPWRRRGSQQVPPPFATVIRWRILTGSASAEVQLRHKGIVQNSANVGKCDGQRTMSRPFGFEFDLLIFAFNKGDLIEQLGLESREQGKHSPSLRH